MPRLEVLLGARMGNVCTDTRVTCGAHMFRHVRRQMCRRVCKALLSRRDVVGRSQQLQLLSALRQIAGRSVLTVCWKKSVGQTAADFVGFEPLGLSR